MRYTYTTSGTCSKQILLDIDEVNNKIREVSYVGGCPGNTQGLAALLQGADIDTVIEKFDGMKCGMKPTSCPDQLARALKSIKEREIYE